MTPQANCCTWPCAILKKIGRCRNGHGSWRPTSSPSCSANASPTPLTNYEILAPHTEFLTGPQLDSGTSNYGQRTYIYNSEKFSLSLNTIFVFDTANPRMLDVSMT